MPDRSQREQRVNRRPQAGFTLLELIIVSGIISILAMIGLVSYSRALNNARVTKATADIRTMEKLLSRYEIDGDNLPATLADIGWGGKIDPWGSTYVYLPFGGSIPAQARKDGASNPVNSTYDLYSVGEDGISQPSITDMASEDDVIRFGDGSYVGVVSEM